MVATLTAPELVSSRPVAREFARELAADLSTVEVTVDCGEVTAAAPSFIDELIKEIVIQRHAASLRLVNVPTRTADYARRSAALRQVADRVDVQERHRVHQGEGSAAR